MGSYGDFQGSQVSMNVFKVRRFLYRFSRFVGSYGGFSRFVGFYEDFQGL